MESDDREHLRQGFAKMEMVQGDLLQRIAAINKTVLPCDDLVAKYGEELKKFSADELRSVEGAVSGPRDPLFEKFDKEVIELLPPGVKEAYSAAFLSTSDPCSIIAGNLAHKTRLTLSLSELINKTCLKRLASFLDNKICVPPNIEEIKASGKNKLVESLKPYLAECAANSCATTVETTDTLETVRNIYNAQKDLLKRAHQILDTLYRTQLLSNAALREIESDIERLKAETENKFNVNYNLLIDAIVAKAMPTPSSLSLSPT